MWRIMHIFGLKVRDSGAGAIDKPVVSIAMAEINEPARHS
jgi:hypothetical protein